MQDIFEYFLDIMYKMLASEHRGGPVAQSVERATPGEEIPGSIPAVAARSQLVGSATV